MKKEELFEALNDIDDKYIKDARKSNPSKKKTILRWTSLVACAAVLICAVLVTPKVLGTRGRTSTANYPKGVVAMAAVYPDSPFAKMTAQEYLESDEGYQWWQSYIKQVAKTRDLQSGMDDYNLKLLESLLVAEDDNTVCSPLNTYIAFSMLAEITDGETRAQILDMLGSDNIDQLRKNNRSLWESNYVNTPVKKSVLANSLWLDESVDYNEKTLKTLTEDYYASSFRGTPGSKELNEALRQWTDTNTDNLLSEYTKDMEIKPDTIIELISTIYYKAMWTDDFQTEQTYPQIFHGTRADSEVEMMHKSDFSVVYSTDRFDAISLNVVDGVDCGAYFFLPKEGVDVNDLVSDSDILKVLRTYPDDSWYEEHASYAMVNISIPKFNVSCKTDLIESLLVKMGVTDVLDTASADFTPLTNEKKEIYLSKAEHAAMLEIDEHGITGAAYTELAMAEGSALVDRIVDFTLDRPFLMLVKESDGSVLFGAIIRNID